MTNETTASERERFEAWALSVGWHDRDLIRAHSGDYREWGTQKAWQGWNARAALPAPADQHPEAQGSSGSLSESGAEAVIQVAASDLVSRVRSLLWGEHPECCGSPVEDTGAEYMGRVETVFACCGSPDYVRLNDAQIVASLRALLPDSEPAAAEVPRDQQALSDHSELDQPKGLGKDHP